MAHCDIVCEALPCDIILITKKGKQAHSYQEGVVDGHSIGEENEVKVAAGDTHRPHAAALLRCRQALNF